MKETIYWKVKTVREVEQDNGKLKKVREEYLVNAVNPTDAEAKITKELSSDPFDWSVTAINETRILKVIE